MKRVRFAPSPTGSLHIGNALSAVAYRALGDWMLVRIDDTDATRNLPGGEEAILRDLEWLEVEWDEGPVRQSSRQERYREAAAEVGPRFDGITLLRDYGTATFHLASVVDDEQLGLPKHDVRYDLPRIRRYAIETIAELPDDELAARVGVPVSAVPVLRGARDLAEARANADAILDPPTDKMSLGGQGNVTVERFSELRERANGDLNYDAAKALVRELKAVGGDLHALRVALTGRDRGPELAAVVAALDRDETLRRLDAAL